MIMGSVRLINMERIVMISGMRQGGASIYLAYSEYLPSLSGACHQLGLLYSDQGKIKEAEDLHLRELTGKEKVLRS